MKEQTVGPPQRTVTEVEVDGRISVYSPSTQELVSLNETASDVWRLCDGTLDLSTIVGLLASSYAVEAHVIADDVRRTIDRFATFGLLAEPRPRC